MKRVELVQLKLEQFQCFDLYEAEFCRDVTNIVGDNGTGKTSLYSGVTWLLFGKDAYGRKEFDIRKRTNGISNSEVDTSVTGTFLIITEESRETINLRRVLRGIKDKQGVWRDNTLCYVNDVPKLVSEYQEYISTIIPEDEFRILTSTNYFLSLDTKEQRDYLCLMAGVRPVEDILSNDSVLKTVYKEKPTNITLSDYIKLSRETLKRLKDDLKGIQPAINALVQSKPKEQNWEELERKKKSLQAEVQSLNDQITSLEESVKMQVDKRTSIFKQWQDAENELLKLKNSIASAIDAKKLAVDEQYNKEAQIYNNIVSDAKKAEDAYVSISDEVDSLAAKCKRLEAELNALTEDYCNAEETSFSLVCPLVSEKVCDVIKGDERNKLEEAFNKAKKQHIDAIMAEGKAKNAEYKNMKALLEEKESELKRKKTISQICQRKIASLVPPSKPIVDIQELEKEHEDKVATLENKISFLKTSYDNFHIVKNDDEMKKRRDVLQAEIDSLTEVISDRKQIERINNQITNKRDEGLAIADKISKQETLIENLTAIERMVIEDAATRINSLFQITQWQVVALQKNGTYKDVCKPTVNGISASLNTATRINVGLDIVQAISNYKQIQVPLFIDNRESINQTVKLKMQVINLRVAPKGTPLTITK